MGLEDTDVTSTGRQTETDNRDAGRHTDNRETDRHIDRQAGRQTERQTD